MQTLFNQFSQVLGTTLLHSLWQGLVIYAVLRIVFLCIPSLSSNSKYNMALLALVASVLWPLATLMVEISKHQFITPVTDIDTGPLAFVPMIHAYHAELTNSWSVAIDNYMPYMVVLWFIGIVLNSARLLWDWRNIYLIKQSATNVPVFEDGVQIIQNMLSIGKKVRVLLSEYVDVRCIVGYLKPMIILPAGIITQFSAEQIKSILIHEMAHIRRNDYFINVIQQVIVILFFFNPFIHLINKIIDNEREHCCDDLVLQITGEPLVYAQTLLQLEETRGQDFQLALAATGKKHYLLNRIKRIMETKKQVSNIRHIVAAALLLLGSMGTIAWLNPDIKDGKLSVNPAIQFPLGLPFDSDTTTKSKAIKAKKPAVATKRTVASPKPNALHSEPKNHDFYYDNPTLKKLTAEVKKRGEELNKYYNSPEFKKLEAQMDAKSHTLDSFYTRPEVKKIQEELDQKSKSLDKMSDNPKMQAIQKKMNVLSRAESAYLETAEYKKLQKDFEEQGKWFEKENASKSTEFKKRSEDLEKVGEALRKYTNDSQHKINDEQLRAYSKQMHDYYASSEFKKQSDDIKQMSEQLRKVYQNPEIKEQQKQVNALSKQIRDYSNGHELKKAKEALNLASAHLREYTNSPAFKKLRDEMQKNNQARYHMDKNSVDTVY